MPLALAGVLALGVVAVLGGDESRRDPPDGNDLVIEAGDSPEGEEAAPGVPSEQDGGGQAPDAETPRGSEDALDETEDARDPVGEWRLLSASPLAARADPVAIWTGDEMLVWGGQGHNGWLADGARYDPSDERWERMATAPVVDDGQSGSVWTGEQLVVLGAADREGRGAGAHGAIYDIDEDRWQPIDMPEEGEWRWDQAVWTGESVVVIGEVGGDDARPARPAAVSFELGSNRWSAMPSPEVLIDRYTRAVRLGGGVAIIGEPPPGRGEEQPVVTALEAGEDAWTPPEPIPFGGLREEWRLRAVQADGRLLLAGPVKGETWAWRLVAWDADDPGVWESGYRGQVLSDPMPPQVFVTEAGVLAWQDGAEPWGRLIDDAGAVPLAEFPLSGREGTGAVWTGSELIVWGGQRAGEPQADGAAWRAD